MKVVNHNTAGNNDGGKDEPAIEDENVKKAREEAESDIAKDPEISLGSEKGDDLDEGELAKLEGEE